MRIKEKNPPRIYKVGKPENQLTISDCGFVEFEPDEQLTFLTAKGNEYDVTRKNWGFYATPSLNSRLARFQLRAVLIKNRDTGNFFILLVERGQEPLFYEYLEMENLEIIYWMDNSEALINLEKLTKSNG